MWVCVFVARMVRVVCGIYLRVRVSVGSVWCGSVCVGECVCRRIRVWCV